jgi:hypothetical protein
MNDKDITSFVTYLKLFTSHLEDKFPEKVTNNIGNLSIQSLTKIKDSLNKSILDSNESLKVTNTTHYNSIILMIDNAINDLYGEKNTKKQVIQNIKYYRREYETAQNGERELYKLIVADAQDEFYKLDFTVEEVAKLTREFTKESELLGLSDRLHINTFLERQEKRIKFKSYDAIKSGIDLVDRVEIILKTNNLGETESLLDYAIYKKFDVDYLFKHIIDDKENKNNVDLIKKYIFISNVAKNINARSTFDFNKLKKLNKFASIINGEPSMTLNKTHFELLKALNAKISNKNISAEVIKDDVDNLLLAGVNPLWLEVTRRLASVEQMEIDKLLINEIKKAGFFIEAKKIAGQGDAKLLLKLFLTRYAKDFNLNDNHHLKELINKIATNSSEKSQLLCLVERDVFFKVMEFTGEHGFNPNTPLASIGFLSVATKDDLNEIRDALLKHEPKNELLINLVNFILSGKENPEIKNASKFVADFCKDYTVAQLKNISKIIGIQFHSIDAGKSAIYDEFFKYNDNLKGMEFFISEFEKEVSKIKMIPQKSRNVFAQLNKPKNFFAKLKNSNSKYLKSFNKLNNMYQEFEKVDSSDIRTSDFDKIKSSEIYDFMKDKIDGIQDFFKKNEQVFYKAGFVCFINELDITSHNQEEIFKKHFGGGEVISVDEFELKYGFKRSDVKEFLNPLATIALQINTRFEMTLKDGMLGFIKKQMKSSFVDEKVAESFFNGEVKFKYDMLKNDVDRLYFDKNKKLFDSVTKVVNQIHDYVINYQSIGECDFEAIAKECKELLSQGKSKSIEDDLEFIKNFHANVKNKYSLDNYSLEELRLHVDKVVKADVSDTLNKNNLSKLLSVLNNVAVYQKVPLTSKEIANKLVLEAVEKLQVMGLKKYPENKVVTSASTKCIEIARELSTPVVPPSKPPR